LLTGAAAVGRHRAPVFIGRRLHQHGAAGADALVPLLAHPSEEIRRLAASAIDEFEALDPRHASALIDARVRGLSVAEAIARTGSEEALQYLQSAWSVGDEDDPARWALPLFGRRAEPFLMRRLAACRQGCSRREADAILYALDKIGPLPDEARALIRDVAAAESTSPELRREMEDQLIERHDPAALPILVRRLAALRGTENEDWGAAHLLQEIYLHDDAAREPAGPYIRHYLSQPKLRRARLMAVATAWVTGYRPAIPSLRALLAEAESDWLLAYDSIYALAELGGSDARPEIARLARDHWYRPVRNQARRALNRFDGGGIELPELRGKEERSYYGGDLHFAVDLDRAEDCRFERAAPTLRARRDAPVSVRWPRSGAVRVELEPPPDRVPGPLGWGQALPAYGVVTLDWRRPDARIVGVDGGHWIGGIYEVGPGGAPRPVLTENVLAVFAVPGSLFVLVKGFSSEENGDLWRLSPREPFRILDGPLRLPATPTHYALTSDRTLLIRTMRGDVVVSRNGRLLRPRACRP
jgi:hypothetical protein